MKSLYLIGGGGHCKSCIDVIESQREYKILGIFDVQDKVGQEVLGHKIIDSDVNISKYTQPGNHFLITVGQIKSPQLRIKLYEMNLNLATIISSRAYVSEHSSIGRGTIVMHDALINAGAVIGENCIINSKALIEHDAIVGDHCHISTGAIINGDCKIGEKTFIGSNTVVKNRTTIPPSSIISYGEKV